MTNHFARLRNNHGAWLQSLLTDQAEEIGTERSELEEFVRLSTSQPRALIALDNPAPARGYALMLRDALGDRGDAIARIHLLDSVSESAATALFSHMTVQARRLANKTRDERIRIVVDTSTLAPHVAELVKDLGKPYGVFLNGEITAEEAAGGDLADPEVKQFFEERGVEVTETDEEAPETAEQDEDDEPDEFASDEAVKESQKSEDEDPYECFDCGERFATPQALGSHSRKHK